MTLLWNEELDVTVNSYFLNHVVGLVQAKEDKPSWNFKGIYGFPEKVNKKRHGIWSSSFL